MADINAGERDDARAPVGPRTLFTEFHEDRGLPIPPVESAEPSSEEEGGVFCIQSEDYEIIFVPTPQFKHMKPEMYRAITMGNTDGFQVEEEDATYNKLMMMSGRGNTSLHVAASLGHSSLVELILRRCPNLIFNKNPSGDLPLHLAAAAGHQAIVETLVRHAKVHPAPSQVLDILVQENEEKNTALHLAMKNHHYRLAISLVQMNSEATIQLNREEVSPLYMAAEAGHVELVNLMLNSRPAHDMGVFKGKSLVHAAIKARNKDMIMNHQATYTVRFMNRRASYCISFDDGVKTSFCIVLLDEELRTPLSFASSIGYLEGVCYFLHKTSDASYTTDMDGSYPIHRASMGGYVKIIEEFIRRCPDSRELLDRKGKNILHVAAESGKSNVVRYILETSELTMLINERDKNGDTPLHLATRNGHARVVSIMTWDKRVNLELVNAQGLTALDVAENHPETTPSYQKRLTWLALRYAGAPRAKQHGSTVTIRQRHAPPNMESYKDRVNTLLLVATLVVTVTFAAGFTMPGGYNSSDQDSRQGMAILVKKPMFHVFLISNTIAMYSSIIVAILLLWAMLNDIRLGLACLKLAVPLLGLSLSLVSLAFMAAICLVVSNLTWLSILVLIIGSLSLLTLLVLIVPLAFPYSLNHRIPRYIIRYPFYLLILVIERINTKK
ncbi:protein ACCELERATED CELL DEATH 6-like isoform X2 [Cornus florida]|uniref:protein ACCELERATED CELL DEATH 6-like isoform X2 n=1 Tax=Cornus florida TaxID=4283 RepID=UPI00289E99A4|nr:protein ACCELERATED CELL DEATH 6-like isoform X2 [Cornus florida]